MVKKGNNSLMNRINAAIAQLDICEPGIRTMLKSQYYGNISTDVIFTAEELAFIDEMKNHTFQALINPEREPYSYFNDEGNLCGITYDAAAEIIKRSRLNIEFINAVDIDEYIYGIENNSADIRFDIADSYNSAEDCGYWLTDPFITVKMVKLFRNNTTVFKTAAEPVNHDIVDDYVAFLNGMGFTPRYYSTINETVNAVLSGECDMSYIPIEKENVEMKNDYTNVLIWEHTP